MQRRHFIGSFASSVLTLSLEPLDLFDVNCKAKETNASVDVDAVRRDFFYRPKNAWAGDFIPFYKNGRFHLFFLLDWRDKAAHGEGTPWFQVSTTDFVHFEEHGQMLARGTETEQDLFVFTGSVIEAEGKFHIFYTGHNPYFPAQGKPQEAIMHAESEDLLHWQKLPGDAFYAPSGRFERDDWRDPFVFRNEQAGEYWMLNAARLKTGLSRRRGCTSLCTSKDLKTWDVREPFWSPNLYFTHECPDLFRIGDWWYLIFSEFSDLVRTRYRMSRSLSGPWLTPDYDYFDARAFYAAKTASNGQKRYLFGWDPTRSEFKDYQRWDWGGNLIVHELNQERDGTLSVRVPDSVGSAWKDAVGANFPTRVGDVSVKANLIRIAAQSSYSCAVNRALPDSCYLEFTMKFAPSTRGCGLMLRTGEDVDSTYYARFEPLRNQFVFDAWPRGSGSQHAIPSVDGEHMPDLTRWIHLDPDTPIKVKVIIDRTIAVIYVADRIAMTTRMYDLSGGGWGFFVSEGEAQFYDVRIGVLDAI